MIFAVRRAVDDDGPTLTLDGEDVPDDAVITMTAVQFAEAIYIPLVAGLADTARQAATAAYKVAADNLRPASTYTFKTITRDEQGRMSGVIVIDQGRLEGENPRVVQS